MKLLIPVLLLAAVGCTTTSFMRDADPSPPPGPAESKVIVYRDSYVGGIDHFPVYEYVDGDGKLLGFTETGCYFEYLCSPGKHLFLTWGEGEAFIEADLAPARTYFIQAWSKFGVVSSRPGFAPVGREGDPFRDLVKIWPDLRCRALDPCKAGDYEVRKEERMQKAKAAYDAGRKDPKRLSPEDGWPNLPPLAPVGMRPD